MVANGDALAQLAQAVFVETVAQFGLARKQKKRGWGCSRRLLEKGTIDHQPFASLRTLK
jgi:hypothetical protein